MEAAGRYRRGIWNQKMWSVVLYVASVWTSTFLICNMGILYLLHCLGKLLCRIKEVSYVVQEALKS